MQRLRGHLNYANVAASLALIVAVAGGTTAIAGNNAPANSVTSNSIKPRNVTARDLAGIRLVQVTGQFAAFAPCGRAERLLGGGGDSTANLGRSRPEKNGWSAAQGLGTGGDVPVTAYALCLQAKPGK
jgi:hypothetical protein